PSTRLNKLENYLSKVKGVMFMGVYPGKEHQKFIANVYNKIKRFKAKHPKFIVQVDGGININVAKRLKQVGVNIVNSGSFISNSDNPKERLKLLSRE
ncbi:ribulose-phosphate 3-epimerase, partial [Candidatus Woesearchaeota archaeon]